MSEMESLEDFRARARSYIREHLKFVGPTSPSLRDRPDEEELAGVARDREVQRILFDGGLAGVVVPKEYGGQGLTAAHQTVLLEELAGYEYPLRLQVPTMTPCMAVLLDFGTEEQKQRHVPAILRGEEIWMQFLSEPGNGSDLAGVTTTAVRDGDEWVLNGSKVWTTGAWWSDWGLCLARTNWDVPKHRGMSVFMLPIDREGWFKFAKSAGADEIARDDIGKDCYVVDDETVALTDGGATRSKAGKVRDVDSDGVWISFL